MTELPEAPGSGQGPRWLPAALLTAAAMAAPSLIQPGRSYFFRDFTLTYYPLRLFFAQEVAHGRWGFWNPYVQEGTFALPGLYPLDLLHVLWPSPAAVSWLLALHVPLAALAFYALGRDLGLTRWGATQGGAVYALGGLALSCVNLYILLEAMALIPLVVLSYRRAALGGGRALVAAAAALAAAVSTTGIELVAQGCILAVALGALAAPTRRAALRLAAATALGLGLAAIPVAVTLGMLAESARGAGFDPGTAQGYSLHPVVLLQTLIPNLFGSAGRPFQLWWGGSAFASGLPYFMSVYVSGAALSLAAVGFGGLPARTRWPLLALAAVSLWFALGSWGGLAPPLMSLPGLRWIRYPSKAVFLPYAVVSLLAGFGCDRLRRAAGWATFARASAALGLLALGVAAVVRFAAPAVVAGLGIHPGATETLRAHVTADCALVAVLLASALGLAAAVLQGRLRAPVGAVLVLALIVADLLRAGAGLNPQVPAAFFQPLPELADLRLGDLGGGRVFSYEPAASPAFADLLASRAPGTEVWTYFLARQLESPYANLLDRVELAESGDRRGFVLHPQTIAEAERDPRRVAQILDRLRNASVTRVLSLEPLDHPDLRLLARAPAGPPGLALYAYELAGSWPRAYLACRVWLAASREQAAVRPLSGGFDPASDVVLEAPAPATCRDGSVRRAGSVPGEDTYEVQSDGAGLLVTRDSFARGWTASVDGVAASVLRANGKHRAVPVSKGRHRVVLRYRAPGLTPGIAITGLAAGLCVFLGLKPRGAASAKAGGVA